MSLPVMPAAMPAPMMAPIERAGDRPRPDAELVKRLDDMDVGKASSAAAAERHCETRT